jgi:cytochrome P450
MVARISVQRKVTRGTRDSPGVQTTADLSFVPFGRETWRDPFPLYRRLRDEDPVHRAPGGYWVLSRFRPVFAAARDTATFSSAQGLTFENEVEALGLAPTIVMMDPPDHTRYRRLVSRGFTPRHVAELEPELRRYARERIAELADAGTGDFVGGLARPVPSWVVAHYLGVPESDRHRFDDWTQAIVQANSLLGSPSQAPAPAPAVGRAAASAGGHPLGAEAALAELYEYFIALVERRRDDRGDDLVSVLLDADDEGTGVGLEGILGYAFVMIAGGNDTTTGLLAGAAELLTAAPDQRRRLVDDPTLIPKAVEELLRLTSPVQGLCRVATRDVEIDGTTIAAGDRVLLLYAAANRDPREFGPDAEELDVGRNVERMLTFSNGGHYCLGAAAARLQGRVVLEELLHLLPGFSVDAAAGTFADGAFTRRYDSLPFTAR